MASYLPGPNIVPSQVREIKQAKSTLEHDNNTNKINRTEKLPNKFNSTIPPTPTAQGKARRIIKKYRNKRREKAETGESLIGNIARGMANLGQKTLFRKGVDVGIKALSSEIAKKNLTD